MLQVSELCLVVCSQIHAVRNFNRVEHSFIVKCLLQVVVAKLAVALACLYFFVCSLSFLATAFRLLSGRNSGKIFANTELLQGHDPLLASLIYMVTKQAPVNSHFVAIIIGI